MTKPLTELSDDESRAGVFAEEFDAHSRAIHRKILEERDSEDKPGTRAAIAAARAARSGQAR